MNKKRLQKLADHLRTVPPEKLNMKVWSCGTSACAMGHACAIPSFRRAGLELIQKSTGWAGGDEWWLEPSFRGRTAFGAAELFFEIDTHTAEFLFDPYVYRNNPRPETVAKRIESVIAKASK